MEFLTNFEEYFGYFKVYIIASSVILALLFMGYLAMSAHLSRIERKIDFIMGDKLDAFNEFLKYKR